MKKTWLITGCSSGIGKGIAEAVLAKGDQAVITSRNKDKLQSFVDQYPENVLAVELELTQSGEIEQLVQQAVAHFGHIDVLVNNAGHGYRAAVEEGEFEQLDNLFQTNLFGPIQLIQAVLPMMRKERRGAIINISSIAAFSAGVGSGYYAASKAALESVSDALYQEVTPLGIKVMNVQPGAFQTRFYDTNIEGTAIKIDDYNATAGKNRKENIQQDQVYPGDPQKAGQIIVETIGQENPPFRLLLGSDAISIMSEALQERLDEIADWEQVSIQTDFD